MNSSHFLSERSGLNLHHPHSQDLVSTSAPLPSRPAKPILNPFLKAVDSGVFWILKQRFWRNPEELRARIQRHHPFPSDFENATEVQLVLDVGDDLWELPYLRATQGKMLLRSEYWRSLSKAMAIHKDRIMNETMTGAIIHIGQPGIGKSVWLLFALIMFLVNGQPVVFNRGSRSVYFEEDAISEIPTSLMSRGDGFLKIIPMDTIGLVDSDEELKPPPLAFTNSISPCFMILSASPQAIRFDPWRKYRSAKTIVMNAWNPSEVLIGATIHTSFRKYLHEHDFEGLATLLKDRYDECGPVARHVFADLATYADIVKKKNDSLSALGYDKLEQLIKDPAHQNGLILMGREDPETHATFSDEPVSSILNRIAMDQLFNRYFEKNVDQLRRFGKLLSFHTGSSASLDWLFESYVHRHIANPEFRASAPLVLKRMLPRGNKIVYDADALPINLNLPPKSLCVFRSKSNLDTTSDPNRYYVSAASNCSFFYTEAYSALLPGLQGWANQATIGTTYGCKSAGMADATRRLDHAGVDSLNFIVSIPAGQSITLEGVDAVYSKRYTFWCLEVDAGFSVSPDDPPSSLTFVTSMEVDDVVLEDRWTRAFYI